MRTGQIWVSSGQRTGRIRARWGMAVFALALTLLPATAARVRAGGIPDIPQGELYGSIAIDGQGAPPGTVVKAVSPTGFDCGDGKVNGRGIYAVEIDAAGDCSNVSFLVNGRPADQQAAPWHLGPAAGRLDLTVSSSAAPVATPAVAASAPGSSGTPFLGTQHVDLTFVPDTGAAPPAAAVAAASPGTTVSFGSGWDLVGAPTGTVLSEASGPAYTLQAGDSDYEQVSAGTPLLGGKGYWVQFGATTSLSLPGAGADSLAINVPTDQAVLIGNPFSATAAVFGAAALYTYDPANGYQPAAVLQPGQGAWATSQSGTITLVPGGS